MRISDCISLLILIVFGGAYVFKLVFLKRRNNITANVLAKGNKKFSIVRIEVLVRVATTLWLVTWISEIIFNKQIAFWIDYLFSSVYTTWMGIIISAVGAVVFIIAALAMKSSWRVGIDKSTKTTLITNGIYRFSRNPAFVGFNLMFIGLFVTYANLLTLFVTVTSMLALHLLIIQEEKHLLTMFGDDYLRYKEKVPRYFAMF